MNRWRIRIHMGKISLLKISFICLLGFSLSAFAAVDGSYTLEVSGDSSTAPIYTLDGSADTQLEILDGSGIICIQTLDFNLDVPSGSIATTGDMTLSAPDGDDGGNAWEAIFAVNSTYKIKQYGFSAYVSFNHKLNKNPSATNARINSVDYQTAQITSKGYMTLLTEDTSEYKFIGIMSGSVSGSNGIKAGDGDLHDKPYSDGDAVKKDSYKYNVAFTQILNDISTAERGAWSAAIDFIISKKKISTDPVSTSEIIIGPSDDPVDTITATTKGTYNAKTDIFSYTATGSGSDKKVSIKLTHKSDDSLIDNKNEIAAAAQKRKF